MKRTLFHQSSMTEGPVLQGMLAFFLPIMLGTLLQQLYSAVDAVVLGQFVGKTALAAVGGSDIVLINLIVNFFVGLSSGASVVISQHAGAQEHEQVSKAVHTAIFLAVIVGALTTLLGTTVAPLLLPALNTPEDTLQYSKDYLVWYFAGMVPSMIYNMGSGILRALETSKRPHLFIVRLHDREHHSGPALCRCFQDGGRGRGNCDEPVPDHLCVAGSAYAPARKRRLPSRVPKNPAGRVAPQAHARHRPSRRHFQHAL